MPLFLSYRCETTHRCFLRLYDKKRTPSVFDDLATGVAPMAAFRRSLSLPRSAVLSDIGDGLYPRGASTRTLVHSHLATVAEEAKRGEGLLLEDDTTAARLEVRAAMDREKGKVLMQLISIRDVR